jgi:hypothetical protein
MRVLELFSGTKSVSKVCREHGYETISLDLDPTYSPDLLMDIMDFDETLWPRDHFHFIWASPPCESYSSARTCAKLEREAAMRRGDIWVAKTLKIIEWFHEAEWCVENPALSRLWARPVASDLVKQSQVTSYCSFGYNYRKNTRIACSKPLSLPKCGGRGECSAMVGSRHLEHAQKGGGGVNNVYHTLDQLHTIPPDLISLILSHLFPRRS